jgi:serine/threonine protein kinase
MLKKILRRGTKARPPSSLGDVPSRLWLVDSSEDPKALFTILGNIGHGVFGDVYQMLHQPTMKVLAGKLIKASLAADHDVLETEVSAMSEVFSQYCLKYHGSIEWDGSIMILMDYCKNGSLRDILDRREEVLSEAQISVVLRDVLKGLQVLQTRHRIVHRDIKASNLLLTDACFVQICDFSLTSRFDRATCETMTIVGTPYWLAPEVISGSTYGFPADVWSLGITAVELAEGAPPYIELSGGKAMIEIALNGFPGYRFSELHSPEFCDFVAHCVAREEKDRWSVQELIKHPFIERGKRLKREEVLKDLLEDKKQNNTSTVPTNEVVFDPHDISEAQLPGGQNFEMSPLALSGTDPFSSMNLPFAQGIDQQDHEHRKSSVQHGTMRDLSHVNDEAFVKASHAMSVKIPFVPLSRERKQETIGRYTPATSPNEKAVVGSDKHEAPARVPIVLVVLLMVIVIFMFCGVEGVVASTAACFVGNLVVWRLKESRGRRQRMDRV